MPRIRYRSVEEGLRIFFEGSDDDDDGTDISDDETDIVVIPPEISELSSDEEEVNDNILNYENDVLPCDTAGEIEVCVKKKFVSSEDSANHAKKQKTENLKWIKKEPLIMPQPKNVEKNITETVKNVIENKTSAEIFDLLFDSEVFSLLVEQTNLYAEQKNRPDFFVTEAYMRRFIGILMLTGYHSLPQEEMYWSLDKDISVPIVRESMSRLQYRNLKQNLHLADNSQIDNTDNLYKVRPCLNLLNRKFQQFGIFSHDLSIDEQMIPYRGRHSAKMFLKGKPLRFGYKAWTLASSDGYVFHFDIYPGKTTEPKSSEYENFGLGGGVVLNLLSIVETPDNHAIYFDNFFTSFDLLCHLKNKGFSATGAIRENRMQMCPLESVKCVREKERGYYDFSYETENKIIVVRWNDNSVVTLASTFGKIYPMKNVSRYSRTQKKKVLIPQPHLIEQYYAKVGGVDLCDSLVANHRIRVRGKKWWWPIFSNYIDVSLVNAWKLSRLFSEKKIPLLDFRREVALFLLQTPLEIKEFERKGSASGRPSKFSMQKPLYGERGHFIVKSDDSRRLRCKQCHSQTVYRCKVCDVALHHDCSEAFHA